MGMDHIKLESPVPVSRFYWEWIKRAFRGRLLVAEATAGLLGMLSFLINDWIVRNFETPGWFGVYLFLLLFLVFVGIGLIRAPRDLYKEAMFEIAALRLTIEDKERIQKALNELWRLRAAGVKLRNKRISTDDYEDWLHDFNQWREEVLQHAGKISENLKQWLDILDKTTQGPVSPWIHETHSAKLRVFSEVLHRLQIFLERDLVWPRHVR